MLAREQLATGVFGLHDLTGQDLAAAMDRALAKYQAQDGPRLPGAAK